MERLRADLAQRQRLIADLRHAPHWSLTLGTILLLVQSVMPALAALAIGELTDSLVSDARLSPSGVAWLVVVVLAVVGPHTLDPLAAAVRQFSQQRITEGVRRETRRLLLAPRGVEGYDDQQTLTDAFTMTRGLGTWTYGLGVEGQLSMWSSGLEVLAACLVVARYSVWLGLFVLAVAITFRQFLLRFYKIGATKVVVPQQAQQRELRYWARVVGGAQSGKEVRTFGFGPWATDHQHDVARRMHQLSFDYVLSILPRQWPAFVMGAVAIGVPMWVMTVRGTPDPAEAGTIAAALAATVPALLAGGGEEPFAFVAARQVDAARQRLLGRAEAQSSPRPTTGLGEGDIVFDDVTFRYPGTDVDVLSHLDLRIPRGQTVAVVGSNGAGKTTLIKLLTNMYEPTAGRITVGGVELATIDADAWRRHLAVVFQDFTHFELSVSDSVGLCELGAVDLQRARRSIDQAVVQHQSDSGLTALLTRRFEGGVELSGGQWQRIALARAFYSLDAGRDVLIMDEPTASLDARSELRLFDSLLRETKGATVIFLSHRFSTVRKADRIVVLEGGRIQEDGSHDELMAYGGRYATMFQAQAASFKEDLGGGS